jgi:transposase
LTQKTIKGIKYYYAEKKERRNGKVRRVWQKYLGTLESILSAVEGEIPTPAYAEIFQFGCVAAYKNISDTIGTAEVLQEVFPKRNQGISIGEYLILAAINRGVEPVSKRSMWSWFQDTILLRLYSGMKAEMLSSQRFWDNLSLVDEVRLQEAWMKIIASTLNKKNINLKKITYDGTNFYTFIGSFNKRCSIAKRGKNKQGRKNLRQVNYALFCTREDQIPLFYDVYEGNRHDAKEFPQVISRFFSAYKDRIDIKKGGITIIFDKGNNSETNIEHFSEGCGYHFVGSVKPSDHKDLSSIPNNDIRLQPVKDPKLEGVKAFRCKKIIYKKELTVVVTFNSNLHTTQVMTIQNEATKCLLKLSELAKKLADRQAGIVTKGRPPTKTSVVNQTAKILNGQYMKILIRPEIKMKKGIPTLSYEYLTEVLDDLSSTILGKNIIITDNHDWKTEEIILSYRSQFVIEGVFKDMKDRRIGTWWPLYHWTDQKILVHGFYCSLSLLYRSLIMKEVHDAGIKISMTRLHHELSGIREVINIHEKGNKKFASKSIVSKMNEVQARLFKLFKMEEYITS